MTIFLSYVFVFFFGTDILTACLALGVAYLIFRSFALDPREYLLGFPIGFTLLAVSYVSFGFSELFAPAFQEPANWLHLLFGSYGLVFLAATYFLRKRTGVSRQTGLSHWLFSFIAILAVFAVVLALGPFYALPSYRLADILFRIFDLGLLGYILLSLNEILKEEPVKVAGLVLAGFSFLAVGQYSLLLWALDGGFWSLALAHVSRIVGLVALWVLGMTSSGSK